MPLDIEPTQNTCEECGHEAGEYQNARLFNEERTLCMECLLDEYDTKEIEEFIELNATEPEHETYETGYIAESVFGEFRVEFDVDRNKEALTQVAVDDFKVKGYYTHLQGKGRIFLEVPGYGDTGVRTVEHRDTINEERQEEAMSRRR